MEITEARFIEFLKYHQSRTVEGRRWRLVINGDFVDFLAVVVGSGRYGAARTLEASLEKLELIMKAHKPVAVALGKFMAHGNKVEIIPGNHDTELQLREVQQLFAQRVVDASGMSSELIYEQLTFHDWAYYEPGVAWIEHGHQYDECCSLEYGLAPVNPSTNAVFENIDTAGMRYMTNQIPHLDPGLTESWTGLGFVRFALSRGAADACRLAGHYGRFAQSLIRSYRGLKGAQSKPLAKLQSSKLDVFCQETGLSRETADKIASMRAKPAVSSFNKLSAVLMIDQVTLSFATAIFCLASLAILPILWGLLTAATIIAAGTVTMNRRGKQRSVDAAQVMGDAALRIGKLVDVPVVSFGHTHHPEQKVSSGVTYVNSGTWIPSEHPGLLKTFVYGRVIAGENIVLHRWEGHAGRPLDSVEPVIVEPAIVEPQPSAPVPVLAPHRPEDAVPSVQQAA